MSEHSQQVLLFDVLRLNERKHPELKFVFAVPNGGQRSKAVAGKLRAEGVKRGVFDIFVPIPRFYPDRFGLFIEMKYGKNKLTDEQKEFGEHLRLNGYARAVCYSADEAIKEIERYLGVTLSK